MNLPPDVRYYANIGAGLLLTALLANILLLGLWLMRLPDSPQPASQGRALLPASTFNPVGQGQTLFQANCASCHGNLAGGPVGNIIGKNLLNNTFIQANGESALLTFLQLGRAANDPTNDSGIAMPARGGNPNLTDEQLRHIIAYLYAVNQPQPALAETNDSALEVTPPPALIVGAGQSDGYQWVKVADNFDNPLLITSAGDQSGRLFVIEQTGVILVLQEEEVLQEPFLNLSTLLPDAVYSGGYSEQGLLGLAFHPDFARNGYAFVSYINREGDSVIARYQVAAGNPNQLDPASQAIVLTVDQPYPDHNGGHLAFGADGYLYIGFGDGGKPAEPNYFSQEPNLFLGKMARLEVDRLPYQIPSDNPFVGQGDFLPEIWALGLRNPWRFSFDSLTGELYIGDVGQWLWEEINWQPADSPGGQNYGWSAYEADQPYLIDETLSGGDLTLPVLSYSHEVGCSVTGGYVYRGAALPDLYGRYFYGDYCNGTIWSAWRDGPGTWQSAVFMETELVIASFGQDEDGNLYVVDYKGAIYRLEATTQ
jgi:glucose/arabinose dehydrogenase